MHLLIVHKTSYPIPKYCIYWANTIRVMAYLVLLKSKREKNVLMFTSGSILPVQFSQYNTIKFPAFGHGLIVLFRVIIAEGFSLALAYNAILHSFTREVQQSYLCLHRDCGLRICIYDFIF